MQYIRRIPYYTLVALLVYMPFHIFLSQSLSLVTGGLEVWKVAKDALLAFVVVFTICLVFWEKKGTKAFWTLVALLAAYSALHLLLWAFHPDIYGRSAALGTIFNVRLPAFAVLGLGAFLTTPRLFVFSSLMKIIIGASTLVAVLGLLQYVLPKDILTHVGYSIDRGVRPAFFIDDNPAFPRIMSTLREPNSLAAYLLLPIGLITTLLVRYRERQKQLMLAGLLLIHGVALYLTQSRSALLAALVTVGLVCVWQYRTGLVSLLKRWWPLLAALTIVACIGLYALRNDPHIKGLISHSTPDAGQTNDLDSNDYHWLFFKQGVEGIIDNPLGHGPGTAGLASIQNPAGSFLTENYYVQVGYEVGVVGLAIFIAINVWMYKRLRRTDSSLAVALMASFWGYVIINMLLHIWANEAVAAQWWILAGVVISATYSSGVAGGVKPAKKRPTPKR